MTINVPPTAHYASDKDWSLLEKLPDGKDCLVCTTSWQDAMMSHVEAKHRHVIMPSVSVQGDPEPKQDVIAWAGDPTDGSLAFIAACCRGIRKRGNAKPFQLMAIATSQPGPEVYDFLDDTDHVVVTSDLGKVDEMMKIAKVYASPSITPTSFDGLAARAACYGCVVVAPNKFGYPEAFGRIGAMLCVHSFVTAEYGMSFAATLVEALAYDGEGFSEEFAASARSAFDPKKSDFAWRELLGYLNVVNG